MRRKILFNLMLILFSFFVFSILTVFSSPFELSLLPWGMHLTLITYFAFYNDNWIYIVSLLISCLSFSLFTIEPWGINLLMGLILKIFVNYSKDTFNHQFFLFPTLLLLLTAHIWLGIDFVSRLVLGNLFYSNDYIYYLFLSMAFGLFAPLVFKVIEYFKRRLNA